MNKIKKAIEKKNFAIGTFLVVSTPAMIEIAGYSGMDFVIIDTEHGPYDTMQMSDLIRAASTSNLAPVVRVADVTHKEIQRAVDNGAEGIIIPYLRDISDFKKAVELTKYAPLGSRGFFKGRGSCFGSEDWACGELTEYMKNSNDKVLLLPQCETKEALESIEEIVNIDGIDGIFIGPFDLSICLGIPAQFDNPEFQAAMDRIFKACKDAGKLCITFTNNASEAKKYLSKGFDAVANSVDSAMLSQAMKDMVKNILE